MWILRHEDAKNKGIWYVNQKPLLVNNSFIHRVHASTYFFKFCEDENCWREQVNYGGRPIEFLNQNVYVHWWRKKNKKTCINSFEHLGKHELKCQLSAHNLLPSKNVTHKLVYCPLILSRWPHLITSGVRISAFNIITFEISPANPSKKLEIQI